MKINPEPSLIFRKKSRSENPGKFYQGNVSLSSDEKKFAKKKSPNEKRMTRRRLLQGAAATVGTALVRDAYHKSQEIRDNLERWSEVKRSREKDIAETESVNTSEINLQPEKRLDKSEVAEEKKEELGNKKEEIGKREEVAHKKYPEKPQDLKGPQAWCDFFMDKYYEISSRKEIYPPAVFRDNFFIAIQLTESGFNSKAQSHKGASGLMQLMPDAIKDLPEFLDFLRRKKRINYSGPSKFVKEDKRIVEKIAQLSQKKPDYNRAMGKLYLANLYYRYGVGQRDWQRGRIKQTWKLLAAAYNQGAGRTEKPERFWTKEARRYAAKVLNYMQRLENIEEHFRKHNLKTRNNYLKMLLAREMDIVARSRKAQEQKVGRYQALEKYLEAIKKAEKKKKQSLSHRELRQIINDDNTLKIVFRKSLDVKV